MMAALNYLISNKNSLLLKFSCNNKKDQSLHSIDQEINKNNNNNSKYNNSLIIQIINIF
jgi:hypothetical protein